MTKVTHNFTLTKNEIAIRKNNIEHGTDFRDCEYGIGVLVAHHAIAHQIQEELFDIKDTRTKETYNGKRTQDDYENWGYEISDVWLLLRNEIETLRERVKELEAQQAQ